MFLIFLLLTFLFSNAQLPTNSLSGSWSGFGSYCISTPTANYGEIYKLAALPNDQVYVGGSFHLLLGSSFCKYLAHINLATGTVKMNRFFKISNDRKVIHPK